MFRNAVVKLHPPWQILLECAVSDMLPYCAVCGRCCLNARFVGVLSALQYVVYAVAVALAYTSCGTLAIILVYFVTIIKVCRLYLRYFVTIIKVCRLYLGYFLTIIKVCRLYSDTSWPSLRFVVCNTLIAFHHHQGLSPVLGYFLAIIKVCRLYLDSPWPLTQHAGFTVVSLFTAEHFFYFRRFGVTRWQSTVVQMSLKYGTHSTSIWHWYYCN